MIPISTASTSPQPPRRGLRKRVQAALATASLVSAGLALAVVPLGANSPVASANGGCTPAAAVLNGNGQYVIDTPGKLASIAGASLSATFVQTADLDLTSCGNWPGIGGVDDFSGVYDGGGYNISNVSLSTTSNNRGWGLFRNIIDATIKNLNLHHVTVSASNAEWVGALVGNAYNSTISDITVTDATVTGSNEVGGVVGRLAATNEGTLRASNIASSATVYGNPAGGVIGSVYVSYAPPDLDDDADGDFQPLSVTPSTGPTTELIIIDAHFSGVVQKDDGGGDLGGLIGEVEVADQGVLHVTRSSAAGNVTAGGSNAGGLIGIATATGVGALAEIVVSSSFASVDVVGNTRVGGLIGRAIAEVDDDDSHGRLVVRDTYAIGDVAALTITDGSFVDPGEFAGGLIGSAEADTDGNSDSIAELTVQNSFAAGAVTASATVGGLIGATEFEEPAIILVSRAFWDTETSELSSSDGGEGKTTADLGKYSTFTAAAWDIGGSTTTWGICADESGYPFLMWQLDRPDCALAGVGLGSNDSPTVLPPAISDLVTRPVVSPTTPTTTPSTTPPATTPSTTTVPPPAPVPVPATGGSLPALTPGASQVLIDGRPETVTVFVDNTTDLVLSGDGFELRLAGQCTSACAITTDANGRQVLTLERQGLARVEGIGFKAGTPVYVWLFSEPTYLGELSVNPDGSFSGLVPLGDIAEGGHTLGANTTPVVLTALMLLGLGLVATGRRRRNLR